jgi:hypothetical protein
VSRMVRAPIVCLLCSACGAQALAPPGDGGTHDSEADHSAADRSETDTGVESGSDGGWTQCAAPGDLAVCGGPRRCKSSNGCGPLSPGGHLGSCESSMVEPCVQGLTSEINIGCLLTPDGDICVYDFLYAPYDLGTLMSKNGGAADVTYADHGAWTGAPLPAPAACPVESGFSLCGPHCAPCPSGGSCTGRSPLHPYGICVPTDVATTASKCFTGLTGRWLPALARRAFRAEGGRRLLVLYASRDVRDYRRWVPGRRSFLHKERHGCGQRGHVRA